MINAVDNQRGRSRFESRTVAVFDPGETVAGRDWKPHAGAIVQVERLVYTRATRTGLLSRAGETAFDVSNQPITAVRTAEAIRAHWRIETTSHDSRDVTFGKDRSRIQCNPGVLARLRRFAVNILKANPSSTVSQNRCRTALKGFDAQPELIASLRRTALARGRAGIQLDGICNRAEPMGSKTPLASPTQPGVEQSGARNAGRSGT